MIRNRSSWRSVGKDISGQRRAPVMQTAVKALPLPRELWRDEPGIRANAAPCVRPCVNSNGQWETRRGLLCAVYCLEDTDSDFFVTSGSRASVSAPERPAGPQLCAGAFVRRRVCTFYLQLLTHVCERTTGVYGYWRSYDIPKQSNPLQAAWGAPH